MGSHKKAYKDRRRSTHPRPDNKVLAKRKRIRKKLQFGELGWLPIIMKVINESR